MANLLATAAAWLAGQQKDFASSDVTYARGDATATVAAVKGRTEFEDTDNDGTVIKTESVDWVILAEDLVLGGDLTVPARGDTITDAAGVVHQVLPFAGEPAWRYADVHRNQLRIHTKAVGP